MKTRKHRKWYQLNGMLRHGKFEGVVESTFAIYHLDKGGEVSIVATGPYIVLCRGSGLAVSKDVAKLTAPFKLARLYIMAVALEDVEIVRLQLRDQHADMRYRFGGAVKSIQIEATLVAP